MTGTGAIPQTFPILKKKIFDYSVASYLVSFVFQILLMMLMLMPSILLAVIAYNTIGFEQTFFLIACLDVCWFLWVEQSSYYYISYIICSPYWFPVLSTKPLKRYGMGRIFMNK